MRACALIESFNYSPYVVLMLHMDGTLGSTTFLDSSQYNHPMSSSSLTIGSIGKFSQGGNFTVENARVYTGSYPELLLTDKDFCIEMFVRITRDDTWQDIISTGASNWQYHCGYGASANTFKFYYSTNGSTQYTGSTSPTLVAPVDGLFHHVAHCRKGGTMYSFLDGVRGAITNIPESLSLYSGATSTMIGRWDKYTTNNLVGYLDDVRIVIGHHVYEENFAAITIPLLPA